MEEKNLTKKCNCDGTKAGCGCSHSDGEKKSGCKSGCSCSDNVLKKARPEIINLLNTDLL